ncbi:MAG: hypothetical protein R2807_03765 [Chitinophagales bacterium]
MGIITPEMEYIAIRENQRIEEYNASLNGQANINPTTQRRKLRCQHTKIFITPNLLEQK